MKLINLAAGAVEPPFANAVPIRVRIDAYLSSSGYGQIRPEKCVPSRPDQDGTTHVVFERGAKILLIGDHAYSSGTERLRANLLMNDTTYGKTWDSVHITNIGAMKSSKEFFDAFATHGIVSVIHPIDIVCADECITQNGQWSFFRDRLHFTSAATSFLVDKLDELFKHGEFGKVGR